MEREEKREAGKQPRQESTKRSKKKETVVGGEYAENSEKSKMDRAEVEKEERKVRRRSDQVEAGTYFSCAAIRQGSGGEPFSLLRAISIFITPSEGPYKIIEHIYHTNL